MFSVILYMLRLLTIALPSYSFHLFSPLTVTFPKLSVILRPLYFALRPQKFYRRAGILMSYFVVAARSNFGRVQAQKRAV
jgi:hypothetical protein